MNTKVYNKTPSYALGGKNIKLNEKMKLIKNRTKYINEKNTRILNSLEINFDIKKSIRSIIYQVRLKTLKFHLK